MTFRTQGTAASDQETHLDLKNAEQFVNDIIPNGN